MTHTARRRRVLLTLWLALVVLIHHESIGTGLPSMRDGMQTVTIQDRSLQHGADHVDAAACDMANMQLCQAASVATVTIVPPADRVIDLPLVPPPARSLPAIPRTVARAPPDLTFISVSRI